MTGYYPEGPTKHKEWTHKNLVQQVQQVPVQGSTPGFG